MTVLTVQVEANQDDGDRQYDDGAGSFSFSNSNNYNRIGSENSGMETTATTCYFRFLDVDIPSTATINSAKLQYKLSANYSSSSKACRIYAEDIASSAAITSDSEMTDAQGGKTSNYATWNLATSSDTSSFQDSADFTDVIDELINVVGWDGGDNNVTILITDPTEAGMMESWEFRIKAHEVSSGADAPKLVIDYTAAAAAAVAEPDLPSAAFLMFVDG
jgi:hypothetical protein